MRTAVLISAALVGARELIAELGADPEALAHEAGLPLRYFDEPDIFVEAHRMMDFFELAAARCHCADFGLRHARRLPMGVFWQIWMGMRTAGTLRGALESWVRLYGLYTDGGSFHIESNREGLWMNYSILPLGRWGVSQMVNLTLGRLCLFIEENLSHRWKPKRVLLRQQPADTAPFRAFFGDVVQFGQERDALLIDRDTLSDPIGMGDVRKLARLSLAAHVAVKGPAVVAQVRALIAATQRQRDCSIQTIARAMGTSERTLQRRLTDAGTSFRGLADAVREDLAWRYVKRTELSIALIADLLGYDCQPAFSRAFRRWYGINPRAARYSDAATLPGRKPPFQQ